MGIEYREGDATDLPDNCCLVHVCNNKGGWGAGFTGAISRRWSEPEYQYRRHFDLHGWELGESQTICICAETNRWVANIVAQNGYKSADNPTPCDLDALRFGLDTMFQLHTYNVGLIYMPRIGCGLGGREWAEIEPIVADTLSGFKVVVFDYVKKERAK